MKQILMMLSGESTVDFYELASDPTLIQMIRTSSSYEELLDYVNESW